jgi:polysaccharide pyruvyl transferase WcaK-like protein
MSPLARLARRARRAVARLGEGGADLDADLALEASMAGFIELAATRYAVDPGDRWRPGQPYKLLLAGYSGTRNTGADVRVEEMIRQLRHLWGDEHLELSLLTIDAPGSRGYFPTVRQLEFPKIFPAWLYQTVRQHHGVLAVEGSMFKSKFANALSTMMAGALGLAAAENKVAVGYGGEAGAMDPALEALVGRACRDTLQICRNQASARILGDLGIPCRTGTDTAWTYQPRDAEAGPRLLRRAGWDGTAPVLVVAPINAFWWPVKADVRKAVERALTGAHADAHYASLYFHAAGPEVTRRQDAYLDGLAEAARAFRDRHGAFVVLYGSEALDRRACDALDARLGGDTPTFVADDHDHPEMVSLLWASDVVVSSRYHAIVCSMAGQPVSVGVTMDERIRNLMIDRGTPELALEVDDPELGPRLTAAVERVHAERAALRTGIGACVVRNLHTLGRMGGILVDHVRERHPEMPFHPDLGEHGDPLAHLPPMGDRIRELLDQHPLDA